jgi:hypothetical protein
VLIRQDLMVKMLETKGVGVSMDLFSFFFFPSLSLAGLIKP